jgi:single-stranded-DNA-specific exonuclease
MSWSLNPNPVNPELCCYAQEQGFHNSFAELLARKTDLSSTDDLRLWLDRCRSGLKDPYLLPDMEKAVERMVRAIRNQETVLVYGDFDADGLTSSSLMYWGLRKAGLKSPLVYIPNRFTEGHGVNEKALKQFAQNGVSLMVTVDCGMGSADGILFAQQSGIDVIVTDHHLPEKELSGALAIVNPKVSNLESELAGVGVAFKFIHALLIKLFGEGSEQLQVTLENIIDYVCIGTIADVVPLVNENRILVHWGLNHLNTSKLPFIADYWRPRIFKRKPREIYEEDDISFYMAPRLNAASRMDSASPALRFMLSVQSSDVNRFGDLLEHLNRKRIIRLESLKKSKQIDYFEIPGLPLLVVDTRSPEVGLLGLLASSLKSETNRSVIALGRKPDGTVTGSARGGTGIHMQKLLELASEFLISSGGHARAAGLALGLNNVSGFVEKLGTLHNETDVFAVPEQPKFYEGALSVSEINDSFLSQQERLGPFGEGNRKPVFGFSDFRIERLRKIGGGKDLSMVLKSKDCTRPGANGGIPAVGFGLGELYDTIGAANHIFGTLGYDWYRNGKIRIQVQGAS